MIWPQKLEVQAGCINFGILQHQEKIKEAKLSYSIAEALLTFSGTQGTLGASYTLLHTLKTILGGCQGLPSVPAFHGELLLAINRLESIANVKAKSMLQKEVLEKGATAALEKVQKEGIKPSPVLQASIDVLKQGKLLEEVKDVDITDDVTWAEMNECVRNMLTVSSLAVEEIKFFYPNCMDRIKSFTFKVEVCVNRMFEKVEHHLKTGKAIIGKYRLTGKGSKHVTCLPHAGHD